MQKPHWTAPASTNASWTGWSSSPPASPSTVTTSWPSACAASTRHAHTSVPSSSTEHEPHSPCSQAFFEPGRPSRSRSAYSRLSPGQTSASRAAPLTVSAILIPAPASAHGRPGRAARAGGRRPVPRTSSIGLTPPPRPARRTTPPLRAGTLTRPATGPEDPNDARSSSALAVGDDGERADRDHHRVPRPDLHERLRRRPTARPGRPMISSSGSAAFRFGPTRNSRERQRPDAAHGRELDRRPLDEQRRQRVPGRRGRPEVPAERPAVADLRRADRPRRLGERRQRLGDRRLPSPPCTSGPSRAAASRSRATSRAAPAPR